MNYFIDVIVPVSLPKPFTYIVSKEEFDFLVIGHRVIVPFGKSKLYTSVVVKKHELYPSSYKPGLLTKKRFVGTLPFILS